MADGDKRSRLSGRLDFETVPRIWPELARRIRAADELEISLGGVKEADSAALAMLVEGLALARRSGCRLRYRDIPESLMALARLSHVEGLLGRENEV